MGLANLFTAFGDASSSMLKGPLPAFNFIETTSGKNLIAKDGSLATIVRVDGIKQVMGAEELNSLVDIMNIRMSSYFAKPGHALQVWFARDPDLSAHTLRTHMAPARSVARRLRLTLDDLFEERERHLPKFVTWEGYYLVLWTRLSSLSKQEMQAARVEMKPPPAWPRMADAQGVGKVAHNILERHHSFVGSFLTDLKDSGIRAEALEAHEALKVMKWSIYPDLMGADQRPTLPGDPIPPRRADVGPGDRSHFFWPRIEEQIFDREAESINPRVVRIGARLFAGVDMSIGPQEILPFSQLLQRMMEIKEFPWRVSFLIEGDGLGPFAFKAFLASIMAMTNGENRQIRDALKGLEAMRRDGSVIIRLRTSFATWAPSDNLRLVEERATRLQRAIESWGYCAVSPTAGDPLAGVMSTALGLDVASTAPAGAPPLRDVVYMLPWNRDASPWKHGAVLFRTPDGRPWPYQPGSSLQTTFIDLVTAPPGYAKSVYLNTTNLALCLSPAATSGSGGAQLPQIAIIDIGPSSSGLISLLKEALPPERRHEASYHRMRMIKEHAINPFDTQLGCRQPLPLERAFLVNFLSVLGTPVGEVRPPSGLPDVSGMAIDELYERFSDMSRRGSPRPYVEGEDEAVDKAIARYDLKLADDECWWGVVDKLFEVGAIHEASLAQRHAVPRIEDLGVVIRSQQVLDVHGRALTANGELIVDVFQRMISTALREYPILTLPTRFDIGQSRVVSLDLDEVAPRGGGPADKQTALMYMLARFVLAKDFYLNEAALPTMVMPEDYRAHHRARIKRIRETPKRIVYDEFHRTKASETVRQQVMLDMREGRKWGIHIALASQLLDDFDKDMVDMATGIWIMGVGTDRAAKEAQAIFGLSATATEIVRRDLRGPGPNGAPFLAVLALKEGKHEHLLVNTLGPTELWSFSTTAEDAALRNRLYETIGAVEARRRLSRRFPGGSATPEIERRVALAAERGANEEEAADGVIEDLVRELQSMAPQEAPDV